MGAWATLSKGWGTSIASCLAELKVGVTQLEKACSGLNVKNIPKAIANTCVIIRRQPTQRRTC
jgi:hypothetical protein